MATLLPPQAVKSVLVMAGSLKRGYPDVDEDLTLIRALVDSNVPKFLADDLPLFAAIVKVRGDRKQYTTYIYTVYIYMYREIAMSLSRRL